MRVRACARESSWAQHSASTRLTQVMRAPSLRCPPPRPTDEALEWMNAAGVGVSSQRKVSNGQRLDAIRGGGGAIPDIGIAPEVLPLVPEAKVHREIREAAFVLPPPQGSSLVESACEVGRAMPMVQQPPPPRAARPQQPPRYPSPAPAVGCRRALAVRSTNAALGAAGFHQAKMQVGGRLSPLSLLPLYVLLHASSLAHLSAATVTCDQHVSRSRAGASAPSRTTPSASLSSLVLTCNARASPAQAQLHLNTRMQQYVMVLLLLRRQVKSQKNEVKIDKFRVYLCSCSGIYHAGWGGWACL